MEPGMGRGLDRAFYYSKGKGMGRPEFPITTGFYDAIAVMGRSALL